MVLGLAGCSGDDTADTAPAPTGATPTTPATTTTVAANPPTTQAPQSADGAALLQSALDRYSAGYEFSATVTVNDEVSTSQEGRWLDGASQLVVRSGDGEVQYITTQDGQWSRIADGPWEELETSGPTDYPLAALAAPNSVVAETIDGDDAVLTVIYAAADLELSGEPVAATIVISDGLLAEVSYTTVVDGAEVESSTEFLPLSNSEPIQAPPVG